MAVHLSAGQTATPQAKGANIDCVGALADSPAPSQLALQLMLEGSP
jgi:hypothetical protein